jgi:hypothetical protein
VRIFDNPGHPAYGPCRRVWCMLSGLGLLGEDIDAEYAKQYGTRWDDCMADALKNRLLSEINLARLVVGRMIRIGRIGL